MLLISRPGRLWTLSGLVLSGTQVHILQQTEDPYSILCCLKLLLKSSYFRNSLDERETEVRTPRNIEKVRQAELQKGTDHILQTNYIFLPPQLSPPLSFSISFSFSDCTANLFDVKHHCFLTKRWSFHLTYSFKWHTLKTKFKAKPAALIGSKRDKLS